MGPEQDIADIDIGTVIGGRALLGSHQVTTDEDLRNDDGEADVTEPLVVFIRRPETC